jgi:tRNA threonylcarbamoyl adenosine modification protein YeaZ
VPDLLFDTASDALVVALAARGEVLGGRAQPGVRAQSLLAVIDELLAEAGLDRSQIERIGVGTGPGGFTGLRVGIATARGLAAALRVPLAGLPTLATLAWPLAAAQGSPSARVWASLDGRRGQRFVQPFRMVSGIAGMSLLAAAPMQAVANEDVARTVGDEPVADGAPTPQGLAGVGQLAAFLDDVLQVRPTYGREPDAKPAASPVTARA